MIPGEPTLEKFGQLSRLPNCYGLGIRSTGYDLEAVAGNTWQIIRESGLIEVGDFDFASGLSSEVKVDSSLLELNPPLYAAMIALFAAHPCIEDADLLLDVPYGVRQFTHDLSTETGVEAIHVELLDPTDKQKGYTFFSDEDKEKALSAKHPVIIEDVVTTLGSVARLRKLFPIERNIHAVAMLLRSKWVDSHNTSALVTHFLAHQEIPLTLHELKEKYPDLAV